MPNRYSIAANASATDASETELVAAPGAAKAINICNLTLSNTSATAEFVDIKFGSTVKLQKVPVPAGLGVVINLGDKPLLLPANTALNFQATTGVSTLYANCTYFLNPNG